MPHNGTCKFMSGTELMQREKSSWFLMVKRSSAKEDRKADEMFLKLLEVGNGGSPVKLR